LPVPLAFWLAVVRGWRAQVPSTLARLAGYGALLVALEAAEIARRARWIRVAWSAVAGDSTAGGIAPMVTLDSLDYGGAGIRAAVVVFIVMVGIIVAQTRGAKRGGVR